MIYLYTENSYYKKITYMSIFFYLFQAKHKATGTSDKLQPCSLYERLTESLKVINLLIRQFVLIL